MITQIKGRLVEKSPTELVIDCNGIGYLVNISLNTYSLLSESESISLYTHLQVKEDSHTLFGFFENTDSTFNFMWSGVNQGYEMTSFWFLVLMVIASYLVLIKREYIYLLHLGILFIFTNLNGSRTAFILYITSLLIIFFLKGTRLPMNLTL